MGADGKGLSAIVYVDGANALTTTIATGSGTAECPFDGNFYVKKGQVVSTRNESGTKYRLVFKPLI